MAHIHTEPGQIDFVVNVFVVHGDTVLMRYHDKYDMWLVPGGHIELNEIPEVACIREVKEEVGLDVALYSERKHADSEGRHALVTPEYMDIHDTSDTHRHLVMIYFATSESMETTEPADNEKSRGLQWMTKDEIENHADIGPMIKFYALESLKRLAK
jgi:ADP-ribose pyrophosphatase YjhB (NUDIX family)